MGINEVMPKVRICRVCGKEFEKGPYSLDICSDECFTKDFWTGHMNDPKSIIINHCCYHDGGNNEDYCGFRGFGGQRFYIQSLKDNSIFTTNNLWSNGNIPDEYFTENTHKFLTKDEYIELGGTI